MAGAAVDVRRGDGVLDPAVPAGSTRPLIEPPAPGISLSDASCSCASCATGGICVERYGTVVAYERAVQAPDQRLRVMAHIVGYVAAALAAPRALIATVTPHGHIGTVVAWRPTADAASRWARYLERHAAADPFSPARFMATDRTVVTVEDIGGRERLRHTPYGAFLTAANLEAVGAMYLRDQGRIVACVGLLRTAGSPPLTADERVAARRLHPLAQAAYAGSLRTPTVTAAEDLFDRAGLTARERDVARAAAQGARNAAIAGALHLSIGTVKIHLHNVYAKFGVRSRTELAARLQRSVGADV